MGLFFGLEPKPLSNLSASRINVFDECVAKLFYEFLLRAPVKPVHPANLVGKALHYVFEMLIKRMLKEGALPMSEKEVTVKAWSAFVTAVLLGTEVIPNQKAESIAWLNPWELARNNPVQQLKLIAQKRSEAVRNASLAIEAFYNLCTRGTRAIWLETEKDCRIKVPSSIIKGEAILLLGYIDLLMELPDAKTGATKLVVFDWKTGKRKNLFEHLQENVQMLIYSHAVFSEYGKVPETYLVSTEVFRNDLLNKTERELQDMLMLPPFRIPVPINYNRQIKDLIRQISEQWFVLKSLITPPQDSGGKLMVKYFEVKSRKGKLLDYGKHLRENRPVPNVGSPACDYCSSRSKCEVDNAQDWNALRTKHQLADIADLEELPPQIFQAEIFQGIAKVSVGAQSTLFEGVPKSKLEKRREKEYGKYNWPAIGFIRKTVKSEKAVRKIFSLIPRHWSGAICACKDANRLWKQLLEFYPQVLEEEAEYKTKQKLAKAADPGLKNKKIQPLRESRLINEMLLQCPLEQCVHKCEPNPLLENGS